MTNAVTIIIIIALAFFSFLDIFGLLTDREGLCLISKPFLVPLIIALYILPSLIGGGSPRGFILTLVIGLALGWLGDVLLMKQELFLLGLLSFLAGHILYIITFAREIRLSGTSWLLLLVIVPYIFVVWFVKKNLLPFLPDRKLAPAIVIYMTVIITMSVCAFLRFSTRSFLPAFLTFSGSALFVVSDLILAFHTFKRDRGNGEAALIMITYIPAQLLIMLGTGLIR